MLQPVVTTLWLGMAVPLEVAASTTRHAPPHGGSLRQLRLHVAGLRSMLLRAITV